MTNNPTSKENKKPIIDKFKLINNSDYLTEFLELVVRRITKDMDIPNFALVCKKKTHDGICITNVNSPIVIISVKSIAQFKDVLKHELVHLKQHQQGYASEDFTKKAVVTG